MRLEASLRLASSHAILSCILKIVSGSLATAQVARPLMLALGAAGAPFCEALECGAVEVGVASCGAKDRFGVILGWLVI